LYGGDGSDRAAIGVTRQIRSWNKVEALEKLMRHLGLLEKDRSAVNVQVNLNMTPESTDPVEFKLTRSE
jgi:hypothetical protein